MVYMHSYCTCLYRPYTVHYSRGGRALAPAILGAGDAVGAATAGQSQRPPLPLQHYQRACYLTAPHTHTPHTPHTHTRGGGGVRHYKSNK